MSISYIVQMKNISDLVPFPSAPSLFSCNVVLRSIPFHSIPIPFPAPFRTFYMYHGQRRAVQAQGESESARDAVF